MIFKNIIHNHLIKTKRWLNQINPQFILLHYKKIYSNKSILFVKNTKNWAIFVIILLLIFFFLIMLLVIFPSTKKKEPLEQTTSDSNRSKMLSRYHLYSSKIAPQKKEYIISPEKVNYSKNKKKLLDDILESELFQREEENIQIQINSLHHLK